MDERPRLRGAIEDATGLPQVGAGFVASANSRKRPAEQDFRAAGLGEDASPAAQLGRRRYARASPSRSPVPSASLPSASAVMAADG